MLVSFLLPGAKDRSPMCNAASGMLWGWCAPLHCPASGPNPAWRASVARFTIYPRRHSWGNRRCPRGTWRGVGALEKAGAWTFFTMVQRQVGSLPGPVRCASRGRTAGWRPNDGGSWPAQPAILAADTLLLLCTVLFWWILLAEVAVLQPLQVRCKAR